MRFINDTSTTRNIPMNSGSAALSVVQLVRAVARFPRNVSPLTSIHARPLWQRTLSLGLYGGPLLGIGFFLGAPAQRCARPHASAGERSNALTNAAMH